MNILIYEYFFGEHAKYDSSPLIFNEAKLIIDSIVKDLSCEYNNSKISLLINKKNKKLLNEYNHFYRNYKYDISKDIANNIKTNDKVLILTPEENNMMYDITKFLEYENIETLNCSSEFIYNSTNKINLNKILNKNSNKYLVRTFKNYKKIPENRSIVAKVNDGLGAQNLFIFKNRSELEKNIDKITDKHIFQDFISGNVVSLNILAKESKLIILSINEQIYSYSSKYEIYLDKIIIGKYNHMIKNFEIFVNSIMSNLDGCSGFLGIDAILDKNNNIIFLEINPRLTTSYIGLQKSIGRNPLTIFNSNKYNFKISNNKVITLNISK